MNITKLAIKRPVAIFVCILALVVFGAGSLLSTPMELAPTMEMPMMLVMTIYPGAGPEEVDSLISAKVEDAASTLSGMKNLQSISSENTSIVLLEMEYGTNMDRAVNDLQKNLDMISNGLPDTAADPIVIEMRMDSMPVMSLSAQGSGSEADLLNYINDSIVPVFKRLDGVASVSVYGGQESYVRVRLDPQRMKQYGLDLAAVANHIASADFSLPAGSAEQGDLSLIVRGGVTYDNVSLLADLPLTLKTGDIIHLSDIADVGKAQFEAESISRYDGNSTINISISKRDSAGTTSVCADVAEEVAKLNAQNSGVQLDVMSDSSEAIYSSLWAVLQAMLLAIVISMVVLFFFLGDIKASLIIGTSMPLSVLATLIIMSFSGITFNILSLGGLTIGVGMMVDNSIVILDSCFKEHLPERSFKESALLGARLVTSAVTASTITTVVVFLPICLMQGMSGQMFADVGLTIVYALTASLISSLTLVPLLFVRMRPLEKKNLLANRMLTRVHSGYRKLVRASFRHRKLVLLGSVLLLVGSFALVPLIGMELMPATDAGQISVELKTKPGLKLGELDKIVQQVEEIVLEQPDLEHYSVTSGGGNPMMGGDASASFTVNLKKDRTLETAEVVDELRARTKDLLNCKVTVKNVSGVSSGMSGTDQVSFSLLGSDRKQLEEVSLQMKELLLAREGVVNATSSLTDGNPQAEIVVDPVKASAAGLAPIQVVDTVRVLLTGKEAATIRMDGADYKVRVEYPNETYDKLGDVSNIFITAPGGRQVPLMDVARIEYSNSPQQVERLNNQYMVSVTAQLGGKDSAALNRDLTLEMRDYAYPEGVEYAESSMTQMMNEEFASLFSALATAIFLVFMVMAIQFESIRFSLMVMISMPFSLIGAFLGLLLTGTTISMTSLLGVIMLMGIVVNNAIVLIDYANQLRAGGTEVHEALVEAGCSRLRPILMTTLTTVLGMVPLAIGLGDNAEMMRGMAMVIIGGLSASTLLTLVLIPTFYLMITKKERHKKDRAIRNAEEDEVLTARAEQ